MTKRDYISAVGRRRRAIARVRLYANGTSNVWNGQEVKKGEMFVNKMPISEYFRSNVEKRLYEEPFRITNTLNKFAITVQVSGGGRHGQLQALIHGVSLALINHEQKYRPMLKKKGFLTRDARVRERRKVGTGGKARRKKQSPKR